ncbi:MAG: MFS transporter [Dehalococcoidia bacterium]
MKRRFTGLWLHANFRKLWAGQAASLLATQLSTIALPLTAVVFLDATPIQMGVIGAMGGVPAIIGLFLGVWVDRRPRGPILVMVDLGRMALLLLVPIAYFLDILSIQLLYFVALGIGGMSMLFEIAYRSFLPSVVSRGRLMEGNSKLELANSGSVAIGPGIGGFLVELVAAPLALIPGAAMYLISIFMFRSLRVDEVIASVAKRADGNGESIIAGIKTGFRFFRGSRTLIGVTVAASTLEFFGMAYDVIYILYAVRNLEFTPWMIGLVFSLGSVGLFGASFASWWLTNHLGIGRTLVLGFLIMAVGGFLVPLASGTIGFVFAVMLFAEATFVFGAVIWNIGKVSLRQAITPEHLLGRVTSLQIVSTRAFVPLGALMGGFLGEFIGLREAIFVFAGGITLSVVWLFVLGVWRIREMPEMAGGGEAVAVRDPESPTSSGV